MIKLLLGGSPCTYWSIAQTKSRETSAAGIGWELFKNYLIAKEKFNPDYFIYENNVSAAQAIKNQIKQELNVYDGTFFMQDTGARYIEINSALVSAQNRERFYVHNCGEVGQPQDKQIYIWDIVGTPPELCAIFSNPHGFNRGGFKYGKTPTLTANGKWEYNNLLLEPCELPVNPLKSGKARCVTSGYSTKGVAHILDSNYSDNPHKQKWDCIAVPVNITQDGKAHTIKAQYGQTGLANIITNGGFGATGVAVRTPQPPTDDATIVGKDPLSIQRVYKVVNGKITIKGKQYDIALPDGNYYFRKLSVQECCRLQTLPPDYCRVVCNTHGYKGVGNGWTADVIIHILQHALKDVPKTEKITVLSMYDGIGTGRYCLDKMGFCNVEYYAYEIDDNATQIALSNYPDIRQCGDAFQLRSALWRLPIDK